MSPTGKVVLFQHHHAPAGWVRAETEVISETVQPESSQNDAARILSRRRPVALHVPE